MNVLLIVGSCLRQNSSANLCHCAYIKGLVDLGYNVDIISKDEKDCNIDSSIIIPKVNNNYTYYGVSIYENISNILRNRKKVKNKENSTGTNNSNVNISNSKIKNIKRFIRNLYGVHETNKTWYNKAKFFKSGKIYDYVISLSTPPISHLLTKKLIDKKNIKYKKWIQIWEDPWNTDLCIDDNNKKIYEEEKRLIEYGEEIFYVSPLTLKYQKELYKESRQKMNWMPLPYYYKDNNFNKVLFKQNVYGYFGDYSPKVRNLEPFYRASIKSSIKVNICGNPFDLYKSTSNIVIYPRLNLDQLNSIEKNTNVLVFLCNLKGGQIPGKIYQYSATYKIILFILDGTEEEKDILKNYFKQFNRYIFCDNTEESILEAIKIIESGQLDGIKNEPIEYFSPKNIMNMILNESNKGNKYEE
ncbi:hypothetical protein [Intestinibacter bartlettii]|uniref:hypothetical protein n=1 Tax=Intestinibacter bartlettii TaxID=261299 RepID=UPI0039F61BF9